MAAFDVNHGVISMALFSVATSITPGPVNVLCFASGARFGLVRSLPYVLGATSAFVGVLLLLGSGVNTVVDLIQTHAALIAVLGAGYMLYLAWKIGTAGGSLSPEAAASCPGFFSGVITQLSNPKAWFVALSSVSLYVLPHARPVLQLWLFSGIFFMTCSLSLLVWVMLGARISQAGLDVQRVNRLMATVLALSVLIMLHGVLWPAAPAG